MTESLKSQNPTWKATDTDGRRADVTLRECGKGRSLVGASFYSVGGVQCLSQTTRVEDRGVVITRILEQQRLKIYHLSAWSAGAE